MDRSAVDVPVFESPMTLAESGVLLLLPQGKHAYVADVRLY